MLRVVAARRLPLPAARHRLPAQGATLQRSLPHIPAGPSHAGQPLLKAGATRGLATGSGSSKDDAAEQRRLEALKRFGVREGFKDTEGRPVAAASASKQPEGVAKAEAKEGKKGEGEKGKEEEVDYQKIWADYIWYMEHQRTQGWKS